MHTRQGELQQPELIEKTNWPELIKYPPLDSELRILAFNRGGGVLAKQRVVQCNMI